LSLPDDLLADEESDDLDLDLDLDLEFELDPGSESDPESDLLSEELPFLELDPEP
jgi:hypothetical protein